MQSRSISKLKTSSRTKFKKYAGKPNRQERLLLLKNLKRLKAGKNALSSFANNVSKLQILMSANFKKVLIKVDTSTCGNFTFKNLWSQLERPSL